MIIYKYPLQQDPLKHQDIDLHVDGVPLYVGEQDNTLCMWYMVSNITSKMKPKRFYVLGTGFNYKNNNMIYLGSAQMKDGIVWHVAYSDA